MIYTIIITNTGETYPCTGTQSLLAAMEALGRNGIPVGCRGGGCGVCKARVDAGAVRREKMSRARISAAEEAHGFVLACRAFPASDLRVTAVDRLARCVERRSERRQAASFLMRAPAVPNAVNKGDTPWQ